jgi:ribosomal protein L31E
MLAPRTRRAKKAIFVLRAFLLQHLKSDDIHISQVLNEYIWENGMRNPNMKVKVVVTKDDKNQVRATLFGEVAKTKKDSAKQTAKKAAKTTTSKKTETVDVKATTVDEKKSAPKKAAKAE